MASLRDAQQVLARYRRQLMALDGHLCAAQAAGLPPPPVADLLAAIARTRHECRRAAPAPRRPRAASAVRAGAPLMSLESLLC